MLNRRGFLQTAGFVTAGALTSLKASPLVEVPPADAVYLGERLDYWLAMLDSETDFAPQVVSAVVAFGDAAVPPVLDRVAAYCESIDRDGFCPCELSDELWELYCLDLLEAEEAFAEELASPQDDSNRISRGDNYEHLLRIVKEVGEQSPSLVDGLLAMASRPSHSVELVNSCLACLVACDIRVQQYFQTFYEDPRACKCNRSWALSLLPIVYVGQLVRREHLSEGVRLLLESWCKDDRPKAFSLCRELPTGTRLHILEQIVSNNLDLLDPNYIADLVSFGPEVVPLVLRGTPSMSLSVLTELGVAAVPGLLEAAESQDVDVRLPAIHALAHIGGDTERLSRLFRTAFADAYFPVRVAAAVGLFRRGRATSSEVAILAKTLEQAERLPRWLTLQGLCDLQQAIPLIDDNLPRLMQDPDEQIGILAIDRVKVRHLSSPEIIAALEQIITSNFPDDQIRRWVAVEALGTFGVTALPFADRLLNAAGSLSHRWSRRRYAFRLLNLLGPAAKQVWPTLQDCWIEHSGPDQADILWSMRAIDPGRAIRPYVDEALNAITDPELCCAALACLERLERGIAASFLPRVVNILARSCPAIQQVAAREIHFAGGGWLPEVMRLLESTDPHARVGAVMALGYCPLPVPQKVRQAVRRSLEDCDLAVQIAGREANDRLQGCLNDFD